MLTLINLSREYQSRPSEIFGIEDAYTAYCLDEACAYIITRIKDGETPTFAKEYKSFRELYKQYGA